MTSPEERAGMPPAINIAVAAYLNRCEASGVDPLLDEDGLSETYDQLDDDAQRWLGESELYHRVLRALPPHPSEYEYLTRPADGTQRLQDFVDEMRSRAQAAQADAARKQRIIEMLLARLPDADLDELYRQARAQNGDESS